MSRKRKKIFQQKKILLITTCYYGYEICRILYFIASMQESYIFLKIWVLGKQSLSLNKKMNKNFLIRFLFLSAFSFWFIKKSIFPAFSFCIAKERWVFFFFDSFFRKNMLSIFIFQLSIVKFDTRIFHLQHFQNFRRNELTNIILRILYLFFQKNCLC